MKNNQILKFLIILNLFFLFNSCNTESIIENNGGVLNSISEQQIVKKGKITFYDGSGNPTFFCSQSYKIYIDGIYVGLISDASPTAPQCGLNSTAKALTVLLDVGNHTYSASGSGTYCPRYTNRTFTITQNTCVLVQF